MLTIRARSLSVRFFFVNAVGFSFWCAAKEWFLCASSSLSCVRLCVWRICVCVCRAIVFRIVTNDVPLPFHQHFLVHKMCVLCRLRFHIFSHSVSFIRLCIFGFIYFAPAIFFFLLLFGSLVCCCCCFFCVCIESRAITCSRFANTKSMSIHAQHYTIHPFARMRRLFSNHELSGQHWRQQQHPTTAEITE